MTMPEFDDFVVPIPKTFKIPYAVTIGSEVVFPENQVNGEIEELNVDDGSQVIENAHTYYYETMGGVYFTIDVYVKCSYDVYYFCIDVTRCNEDKLMELEIDPEKVTQELIDQKMKEAVDLVNKKVEEEIKELEVEEMS